jgi:hypothetical protein
MIDSYFRKVQGFVRNILPLLWQTLRIYEPFLKYTYIRFLQMSTILCFDKDFMYDGVHAIRVYMLFIYNSIMLASISFALHMLDLFVPFL